MEATLKTLTATAEWVARNSLEGSLLIAAFLLLVVAWGKRLSPTLRIVLWAVVGIRLLLPFAPESAFSVFNLTPGNDLSSAATMAAAAPVEIAPPTMNPFGSPAAIEIDKVVDSSFPFSWSSVLTLVWVAGVVLLLGMALARQVRTSRWVRRLPPVNDRHLRRLVSETARQVGVQKEVHPREGPAGIGVAIFGNLRETHLILPEDFPQRYSEVEIRGILLHEFAHVRRHDLLLNWIVLAIQALHWFNPLVWIAGRRFLADREMLCDRAALEGLPSAHRRDYGAALIKALELGRVASPCPALVPFFSRKTELQHRLLMIANPQNRNPLLQMAAVLLAAVISLATFTSAQADAERGESRRESPRDGEREGAPAEGRRDGEGDRAREDARDGDRPGEGGESREGARDGDRRAGGPEVTIYRDGVAMGDRKYTSMADFRNALRGQNLDRVLVVADPNTPFQTVNAVLDALKAQGISDVTLAARDQEDGRRAVGRDGDARREGEMSREGARDGDAPREGTRDGDRPREGARDGDRPREDGQRDGDRPREGARDGDAPREGSREGARDGDAPREGGREGARDGEMAREGARDGEGAVADDRQIAQWTRIYGAYDKDRDGGVTFEEWVAMKNYELTRDQEKREKGWFDQADGNGDEKVTVGEWIDWKANQGR